MFIFHCRFHLFVKFLYECDIFTYSVCRKVSFTYGIWSITFFVFFFLLAFKQFLWYYKHDRIIVQKRAYGTSVECQVSSEKVVHKKEICIFDSFRRFLVSPTKSKTISLRCLTNILETRRKHV